MNTPLNYEGVFILYNIYRDPHLAFIKMEYNKNIKRDEKMKSSFDVHKIKI